MHTISCNIGIANWLVDSADDPLGEFLGLATCLSMNSPDNDCRISVFVNAGQQSGLTGQISGRMSGAPGLNGGETAFNLQIGGNDISPGDPVTVELTAGEVSSKVMTAEVQSMASSLYQTRITGATVMERLTRTRLNQVYENQSLNQIVSDLASQAGVDTGQIDTGSTYSYFVVEERRTLLDHVRQLALCDGMDVYAETDNKLTVTVFNKTAADHIFRYGMEILDLQMCVNHPVISQVRVSGESPSSSQGTDTWPWLVKDISSFQGESGDGGQLLTFQYGAIRTKDVADSLAAVKLGVIKDQSTWGRLKILGNPAVKLGDAIEIKDTPKPELNGLFKVTEVRHVLSKTDGYITFVGFSGLGGSSGVPGF